MNDTHIESAKLQHRQGVKIFAKQTFIPSPSFSYSFFIAAKKILEKNVRNVQ